METFQHFFSTTNFQTKKKKHNSNKSAINKKKHGINLHPDGANGIHWVMNFLKGSGDEIIRHLNLKIQSCVLDVATGTGEPGLSIAAIVKNGKVVGQDLVR